MGISRDTFRHASIYSVATVLGKGIGFLMLPFYARYIGGEGYGIIGMVDATLNFLMSLLGYGIAGGVTRFYHEENSFERKRKVLSTAVALIWGVAGSLCVFLMLFSPLLSRILFGSPSFYKIVCLALAGFVFDLTAQTAGSYLVIEQRSTLFSLIGLVRLFVGLSLNIYLIIFLELGLNGYFLSGAITAFMFTIIFNVIVVWECGVQFDCRIASKLIGFEWPLIPGNMVSFISRQVERVLLRFMVNLESVGILEMGCKFPSLIPLLVTEPFMQAWNTRRTQIAERPEGLEEIGRVFTYFLYVILFVALLLFVSIAEIISMALPREFAPSSRIARVEVVTVVFLSCYYHLLFGLYYTKKTKAISIIKASTSVLKIPLSFAFIYWLGLFGAAYAACLTTFVQMVCTGVMSQRAFRIPIEGKKVGVIFAGAVLICAIVTGINFEETGIVRTMEGRFVPAALNVLGSTFLGDWRAGLIPRLVREKSMTLMVLTSKVVCCLPFAFLLPVVHDGARRRLSRAFGVAPVAGS